MELKKMVFKELTIEKFLFSIFAMLLGITTVSAAPVVRTASGANPAAIQSTVDQFRADLGGVNNTAGGSFTSGRREINWDGVPDTFAEPNFLPGDFFNVNSPRGIVFQAIEDRSATGNQANDFLVSADSNNPTNTPVRFGAPFSSQFQTFSQERLFVAANTHLTELLFFIPGTKIPATVSGFGVVFTDVDSSVASRRTIVRFYGIDGKELVAPVDADVFANGLSFVGVSFNAGERVARVIIESGVCDINCGGTDGTDFDVVAMDDFIYGEPRAAEHHTSDFDGDGTADFSVFRPSVGAWFILNSGSNTFNFVNFGANGDIPVDCDFDGDKRSDITVFRPSTGTWFRLNSSDNGFSAVGFGANGDKPTPGDYDKDGKTDISVWRPSTGSYFILRSSNGQFQSTQWGANGDIPIGASPQ